MFPVLLIIYKRICLGDAACAVYIRLAHCTVFKLLYNGTWKSQSINQSKIESSQQNKLLSYATYWATCLQQFRSSGV